MQMSWRVGLRWILVPFALAATSFAALAGSMLLPGVEPPVIAALSTIFPRVPPALILSPLGRLIFLLVIVVWIVPVVLAVGFALGSRWVARWFWSFCVALAIFVAGLGYRVGSDRDWLSLGAAILIGGILASAIWLRLRGDSSKRSAFGALAIAACVIFLPCAVRLASAGAQPPVAHKRWSVVLQNGTWQGINTGSEFAATRQVVIAGNRVIVVFDAAEIGYLGKQPMSRYRILSLDLDTGAIRNQMELTGRWGSMPYLFATQDGHVVLDNGNLQILNSDLTATGRSFAVTHGRVVEASPDGTTLAWETDPGTVLLDSTNFSQIRTFPASVPGSVSREAFLSNNVSMPQAYPGQQFVTRTDARGSTFILHDRCIGSPEFLSNGRILVSGCGRMLILDFDGKIVAQRRDIENAYTFAGVSQNGARFALQAYDETGDPSFLIYEHFYVYDVASLRPLATIPITNLPERQSWTAFSPDGRFFAVGNPNQLNLYELP